MTVDASRPDPAPAVPLAEADAVRVVFGNLVAVRDVSLKLSGGDLVGLIGPNGAGKTTLMRAMAGLQSPTAGSAFVMGQDVFGKSRDVRRHIGFAPDSPPVYEDLSIRDFLTFIAHSYDVHGSEADERIDFWLEQLWLTEKSDEKIAKLSRGMRQRVTVARTLVPNPTVIFLDEPSSGLDPAGRIQFRNVLAALRNQGKALIVSSHILADLEEYCTHIAIIEHGAILRYGTVGDLHDRTIGRSRYRFTLAAETDGLNDVLAGIDGLSGVEHENGRWIVEYHEGADHAAALLRVLIDRDVSVASFDVVADSLEQMYLKSGVKQVD